MYIHVKRLTWDLQISAGLNKFDGPTIKGPYNSFQDGLSNEVPPRLFLYILLGVL